MQLNEPLEHRIAWTYPNEFEADTWIEKLLPRWIDKQLDKYHQSVRDHKEHAANWPAVQVPEAPMPSDLLMQACTVYAQQSGLTFDTLAFCLLSVERKALEFKQGRDILRKERDHYKFLWEETDEGKETLQQGD